MKIDKILIFLALLLTAFPFRGLCTHTIIGGETTYVVNKGDSFELIGAQFGVHWKNIPKWNGLDANFYPVAGTTLRLNTRKIVPRSLKDGIVINIPDRTLYFFKGGSLKAFPVGVGRGMEDRQTATGRFRITKKRANPTWYVPKSIQVEAMLQGKPVEEVVPPGPDNPLGRFALVTSIPGILIHETIWPKSVYRYRSHGCIRVLPEHMEQLYRLVDVDTEGEIIYEPVKLAVAPDGRIYLEVRSDVYKRITSLREHTRKLIEEQGLSERVDWKRVEAMVRTESGVPEVISIPFSK
ncbi:MAG TPA: L,D-transpeptidase family protein [Syntrophorhabdaceae bacterium]|nr:L,D-transpeptidase family protein [Syntrophorhabdaceae bacterium]HQM82320.1 L,D-transpeptidase family protein [Syntrophorhabdaceae bacterium]